MSRIIVRPHLDCWYVWRNSRHIATITRTPHAYILTSAIAPRIRLGTHPTWISAKHHAKTLDT